MCLLLGFLLIFACLIIIIQGIRLSTGQKGYPAGLCWLSSRALWLSSRAQGCFVEPCWITSRALWLSNRAQGCFVEGKGSRQNRSVTLGKGLALRVGYRGPCSKAVAKQTARLKLKGIDGRAPPGAEPEIACESAKALICMRHG